jgi:hypothetical protein
MTFAHSNQLKSDLSKTKSNLDKANLDLSNLKYERFHLLKEIEATDSFE